MYIYLYIYVYILIHIYRALRPTRPQISLDTVLMFQTHPFLPHPPSTLSFPFLFCCTVLHFSTILTPAPQQLVFADTTAAAVYALAPPPLVLTDTADATVFTRIPHSLVLAETVATAVFTCTSLPLVLADAAATAVLALAPLPLVHAEATASTVLAHAPPPMVLADAAATAVFTLAPLPLVLADAATSAVFTLSPVPLVLADAATAAVFTLALPPLVLAEAAAAAVFAPALLPLVLAQSRSLAGLLGCRRMSCQSYDQACGIGCVHISLFMLAALSLWPSGCVPLQHSLLARCGSLQAIRVIRHPTLRRILHGDAFCALSAVLPLSRGAPVSVNCFARPLRSCERRQYYRARSVAESQSGHEAVRHRDDQFTQR